MRTAAFVSLVIGAVAACHPLAVFHPRDLPPPSHSDAPRKVVASSSSLKNGVRIYTDDLGIPHMFGESETDLSYALGFMHARDRGFQVYMLQHAATGRLTEVFGAELLDVDRELRLRSYRLNEQVEALAPRDRGNIEAYCDGFNAAAADVGRSAEMAILAVDFEPLTVRDVLAITRLQQWDQSVGFDEELARFQLLQAVGTSSPLLPELMADAPSGGVPIVSPSEHDGAPFVPHTVAASLSSSGPASATTAQSTPRSPQFAQLRAQFLENHGASNSWSVVAAKTGAGVAVLANDPHLGHGAPGIFYLVHMHAPDVDVAGGTFPGIPAVLIGHGRHIAWGITNAYADTMDLVRLHAANDDSYDVDGARVPYQRFEQQFRLGKAKDAPVHTETWRRSQFGVVVPKEYGQSRDRAIGDGATLALLWTAAEFPRESAHTLSAFWDLARAKDAADATIALQHFTAPAMNINMAFTDGTIAYRLSGIIPVRASDERVDLPRDGTHASAGWQGVLPADQKPRATNPDKGYIVAANQRIVDNGVASQAVVGFEAARPWRAMRIDERLRALFAHGKPSTEELLSIQQDPTSLEAKTLAPLLGAHCPAHVDGHDDARTAAFCAAVKGFDGVFSVDAVALPYVHLARALGLTLLEAHIANKALAAGVLDETSIAMALIADAQREHAQPGSTLVFDDPNTKAREGFDGMMVRATKRALDTVVDEAGADVGDWRWGTSHKLSLRGVMARAPVIGGLFQTDAREEAGTGSAPRAEHGDFAHQQRVNFGAGLRLIAEMSEPPLVRMVNDSGESGHFGHRHLEDQYPLWHAGTPRKLALSEDEAQRGAEGMLVLLPRQVPPTEDGK